MITSISLHDNTDFQDFINIEVIDFGFPITDNPSSELIKNDALMDMTPVDEYPEIEIMNTQEVIAFANSAYEWDNRSYHSTLTALGNYPDGLTVEWLIAILAKHPQEYFYETLNYIKDNNTSNALLKAELIEAISEWETIPEIERIKVLQDLHKHFLNRSEYLARVSETTIQEM